MEKETKLNIQKNDATIFLPLMCALFMLLGIILGCNVMATMHPSPSTGTETTETTTDETEFSPKGDANLVVIQ